MEASYFINLTSMSIALAVSVILLVSTLMAGELAQPVHRWFFLTVLLNITGVLCEFAVGLLIGRPGAGLTFWLQAGDFAIYATSALMNVTFTLYLIAYLREKNRAARGGVVFVMVCSAVSIALAAVSQFTGLYSYYDTSNYYHQAGLFWVALVPPVLSLCALTLIILRHRGRLAGRELATLLAYTMIPIACTAVEVLMGDVWLSHFAASIALLLVYLTLQVETRRRMKEQEMALTESRVAVMHSQIQPHFLFNTLSAITRLCESQEARTALGTFADYLRVNMDALSRKEPVPFAWELEHVRQYLWLEGLRFEERLRVVYDIRADGFSLPVLTVQPLVENAVRHGVTKRAGGGTITLRTEETAAGYRITVADDGVGFPAQAPPDDGRSHTGLRNVRLRLEALCGGTLQVRSAPGEGTEVTIDIPK